LAAADRFRALRAADPADAVQQIEQVLLVRDDLEHERAALA
jgi:hypothetical protein